MARDPPRAHPLLCGIGPVGSPGSEVGEPTAARRTPALRQRLLQGTLLLLADCAQGVLRTGKAAGGQVIDDEAVSEILAPLRLHSMLHALPPRLRSWSTKPLKRRQR